MQRYYTRACNFYFDKKSKEKIKKKLTFPLGGNNSISFDSIEIISIQSKDIVLFPPSGNDFFFLIFSLEDFSK